jgi:acyl-homoserine-lactone acylase
MVPFRSQSVRLAVPDITAMLEQALKMVRARSAPEFRAALQGHGLSMWNIVYADTHGHIGYQYNANVPRRNEEFDWTKPVPGADPKTRWTEFWSLDALPHIEDPPSGLLINANTAPWLTTLGKEIPADKWPRYVSGYGVTTRYERLQQLLIADTHVTPETAKTYATDTLVPYSRSAVAALTAALAHKPAAKKADQSDKSDPSDTLGLLRQGAGVLAAWNGRADPAAHGCGLYLYWLRADKQMPELARRSAKGGSWSEAEQTAALAALETAGKALKAQHGALDAPWSEVHVSQRGAQTQPVSGLGYVAPGDSTATVTPNFGPFRDGKIVCNGGSSFRMVVDLDPKGVKSWSILPYGDSQDPANPHYADQQAMFGRGEYKDTYYGVARIKKAAAAPTVLKVE